MMGLQGCAAYAATTLVTGPPGFLPAALCLEEGGLLTVCRCCCWYVTIWWPSLRTLSHLELRLPAP